jgi:hypothetical protein
MRVQIPAYTDRWMKGDRFGEVVKTILSPQHNPGEPDKFTLGETAYVKLDISGKTIRVLLTDCTVV